MSKINIIILSFLIKLMAATGIPSEVPTIESLGLRVSLVVQPAKEQVIRARAANTLLEIYHHLNRAGTFIRQMPGCGYEPSVIPGGNWEFIDTIYGRFLAPKINCSMNDALSNIRTASEGTIRAECITAAFIAKIAVTDCFLEAGKKNTYNSEDFLKEHIQSLGEIARVSIFQDLFFQKSIDKRNIETGDAVYLHGHSRYKTLNPTGPSRGENVYMIGYGADNLRMYVGFGDFFKDGPKTAKQIQERLAADYIYELSIRNKTTDKKTVLAEIREIQPSHGFLKVLEITIASNKA